MKNKLTISAAVAILFPMAAFGQSPHEAVVAAEMAFAAQATQTSTEAAFLANSSPTALVTENGKLANAQEVWRTRPSRPGSKLTWYPVLADAAQSGDLGYTTGPWTTLQNNRPVSAGEYVTVWRKQLDGRWKFAVDMGIERIGAVPAQVTTVARPHLMAAAATPSTAPSNIVLDVDSKFAAAELMKPGATYQQYLSAETRLYRSGLSMMQGAAASANMKSIDGGYLFIANTGYLAAAGDLGYVVGSLHRPASTNHPEENGTFLRIWRREADAGWRIALEMFNFTPGAAEAAAAAPAAPAPAVPAGTTGQVPAKRGQ
ncbi:ketosteroid isomerase-like protein [Hymenobacter sp. UYAg731]